MKDKKDEKNIPRGNKEFWEEMWHDGRTNWDVGYAAPPITEYADQLKDKKIKILIPGAGNAYEAEYLHKNGFENVYVLDIASKPLENFKKRAVDFPREHLLNQNFFEHAEKYDLIIEQTFFIALEPKLRTKYAEKINDLLKPGGKLAGLLITDTEPSDGGPPFIDTKEEYIKHFEEIFDIKVYETAYNSIKPRAGREMFINFRKDKKSVRISREVLTQ
jgi:thiopurine S-methyltransferase